MHQSPLDKPSTLTDTNTLLIRYQSIALFHHTNAPFDTIRTAPSDYLAHSPFRSKALFGLEPAWGGPPLRSALAPQGCSRTPRLAAPQSASKPTVVIGDTAPAGYHLARKQTAPPHARQGLPRRQLAKEVLCALQFPVKSCR